MNYTGIDYGLGKTNIDHNTGIRFGVIHAREVGQVWYDESEAVYPIACPYCDYEFEIEDEVEECQNCHRFFNLDEMSDEVICFKIEVDEKYRAYQGGDDPDIFIEKSPYFTYAQFCSPCAPGAVYLMNYMEKGEKGYCFGHDWFENGRAPYPVYDVKTGLLVD